MTIIDLRHALAQLSELLDRIVAGEAIVIARNGKPLAQLRPIASEPRRPGRLAGKIWIAEDFDAPLPDEMMEAFGQSPVSF